MPGAFTRKPARFARHDVFVRVLLRERSLAKAGEARVRGELQRRIVWDLDSHVGQSNAWDRTRDPAHLLAVQEQLVSAFGVSVDFQHSQAAVDFAAVALPRDRLLPRIAALREADVRLVQSGL